MSVNKLLPGNMELPVDVFSADKEYIKSLDVKLTVKLHNRVLASTNFYIYILDDDLRNVSSIIVRNIFETDGRYFAYKELSGIERRFIPHPVFLVFDSIHNITKYKLRN